MPIDRDKAKKAAGLFRGMRMFPDLATPDGKAVMASIVDRLQEGCENEAHALRVAAALRDSESFFPTPAAIVQKCAETRETRSTATAAPHCAWCSGTGWEVVRTASGEGVRRCRCGGLPPLPDAVKSFESPAAALKQVLGESA